jgi:hypothetical protein
LAGGSPFKREVRIKMGKKKIIWDLEPESWICRTEIGVNKALIIYTTSTKLRNKEHQEQTSQDKADKKKDRYRPIRHAG